jgi:DivIVA domain-containing protein
MRRKKSEQPETISVTGDRITPNDVQQVEFRLAFRGYNERDVDAFLDRVTEDLSHYLEENQRLRSGSVSVAPTTPPDVAEAARREAEEILQRARDEAAEIVRSAEREAAAIQTTANAGSAEPRAAVAPFLNRERDFLQSLGTIVQSHAEEIRSMVMTLRAGADRAAPESATTTDAEPADARAEPSADHSAEEPAEAPAVPTETAAEEERSEVGAASVAEIRERLEEGEGDGGPGPVGEVVVDATEPVYAPEGAQAGEGRERSLRELFWGDE